MYTVFKPHFVKSFFFSVLPNTKSNLFLRYFSELLDSAESWRKTLNRFLLSCSLILILFGFVTFWVAFNLQRLWNNGLLQIIVELKFAFYTPKCVCWSQTITKKIQKVFSYLVHVMLFVFMGSSGTFNSKRLWSHHYIQTIVLNDVRAKIL